MCKKCLLCDRDIQRIISIDKNHFCCEKCVCIWSKDNVDINLYNGKLKKIICKSCNIGFLSTTDKRKYCSRECNKANQKTKLNKGCKSCNKELKKCFKHLGNYFCTQGCAEKWVTNNFDLDNYSGTMKVCLCKICGKKFASKRKNKITCSKSCFIKCIEKEKTKINCDYCNKEYEIRPAKALFKKQRKDKHNFCSQKCYNSYYCGSNHPHWISDRSKIKDKDKNFRDSKKMLDWRKLVFERDDYTCQVCRSRGGYLNAHHIKKYKDYPEYRTDINNGITLCNKHHKMTYGKEEIFENLFNNILKDNYKILTHIDQFNEVLQNYYIRST